MELDETDKVNLHLPSSSSCLLILQFNGIFGFASARVREDRRGIHFKAWERKGVGCDVCVYVCGTLSLLIPWMSERALRRRRRLRSTVLIIIIMIWWWRQTISPLITLPSSDILMHKSSVRVSNIFIIISYVCARDSFSPSFDFFLNSMNLNFIRFSLNLFFWHLYPPPLNYLFST